MLKESMLATPPIDYPAMRAGIIAAVALGTGLASDHVIINEPAVPNSPRPSLPYMGFKFTTAMTQYGSDANYITLDPATNQTMYNSFGQRSMSVSFNAYAPNQDAAYALMVTWQAATSFDNVNSALAKVGLAVWDTGNVQDMSALVDTSYEGRAQMDATMGVASVASYANPYIITSATVHVSFAPPDTIITTLGA